MSNAGTLTLNLQKSLAAVSEASSRGADLILFPEVQLTEFFPQYPGRDVSAYACDIDGNIIGAFRQACRNHHIMAVPNVYLKEDGRCFDASILIGRDGEIIGIQKMVHVAAGAVVFDHLFRSRIFIIGDDEHALKREGFAWLMDFDHNSAVMIPAAGLIPELPVRCDGFEPVIIDLRFRFTDDIIGKPVQCLVLLKPDHVAGVVLLKELIQFRRCESAVASCITLDVRILLTVFFQERLHEGRGILAAIVSSAAEYRQKKITGDSVIADERMISDCLIVGIESSFQLMSIRLKECGVHIEDDLAGWIGQLIL